VKPLKWSFWLHLYLHALGCADADAPVLFHSRIDGALLPADKELTDE
jgi:hypothetical protein